jgi:preprotein translocase subunit SecF
MVLAGWMARSHVLVLTMSMARTEELVHAATVACAGYMVLTKEVARFSLLVLFGMMARTYSMVLASGTARA